MAKRCFMVNNTVSVADLQLPINWALCIVCQAQTGEKLQCPGHSLRADNDLGYESFGRILSEFEKRGLLPPNLTASRLGDDAVSCLKANYAKWHKSCRNKFSPRELQRKTASMKKHADTEFDSALQNEQADSNDNLLQSVNKRRCTRSDFFSDNPLRTTNPLCFFCDQPAASNESLHDASTDGLYERVKECALALSDARLLAKLAIGDMVSIEAKYHSNCLAQLYNRRRSLEREHYRRLSSAASLTDSLHSIVFAQLVAYIGEVRSVGHIVPVFKLADLKKLYTDRLNQLNPSGNVCVNSTRLKEKLLKYFPDMRAESNGRDVILIFDEHIGLALSAACDHSLDEDALHLSKAAEIVRREMFSCLWQTDGSLQFTSGCQEKSVPQALLVLISMILEGPGIDVQTAHINAPAAASIAQLVVFNSVRHKRTSIDHVTQTVRHSRDQETPLPLYVGLTVHATTRKKRLVDKLYELGLSVSYDRILSILGDFANDICNRSQVENVVYPLNLKTGIFTTAAVDNIDHNESSTSAQRSFHGTAISLQQHPDAQMPGTTIDVDVFRVTDKQQSKLTVALPESYTYVPHVTLLRDEPTISVSSAVSIASDAHPAAASADERAWLDNAWQNWKKDSFRVELVSSWSAFHARKAAISQRMLSVIGMLPMFHEQAHSVSMIRHAMDVVHSAITKLNPGQVPIVTFDQPLYALAKLVQWNWPDSYGEDKFLVMFGGLHIEIAALKTLGSLLEGSGWVEALTNAGILTAGSAEALLSASHVRRCRRSHEVTLVALHILQYVAYEKNLSASSLNISFDEWCKEQSDEHYQFAFWSSVKQLQMTVLTFVRSIRESNFGLYVESLTDLMPWFFALDRTNYARWLSVHIRDMSELSNKHPDIFKHFNQGNFTVHKTANRFSAIAIDHAHEQLNAVVKGDGGIIGLTENDSALHRWIITGPEVARLIEQFEYSALHSCNGPHETRHHEDRASTQETFVSDVCKLVATMQEMGNPFEEPNDLVALHNRNIVDGEVARLAGKVFNTGKSQFCEFVKMRLNSNELSLFAPIKRNSLSFFVNKKPRTVSKMQGKITAARNDSTLFSRLFIACQIRNSDLDEFFRHENQAFPPALSDAGNLHFGSKSDLLQCLEALFPFAREAPCVDAKVLDGSVVVNMLRPGAVKTFDEYVLQVFMPYIKTQLASVRRLDVVWDQYGLTSLKAMARQSRGLGLRRQVTPSSPVPHNWHEFLRNDDNKTALFTFLADRMCGLLAGCDKHVIGTLKDDVRSSVADYDTTRLQPCGHEEADTRMILHVSDLVLAGYRKILLRTVDTDVVVLSVAFFSKLGCEEMWIAFGTGQHLRYIPVHELSKCLGPDRATALLMFHAITGCDTVSAFVGIGKKTAWDTWNRHPAVTQAFVELSSLPQAISDESLALLERLVVLMYDRSCTCATVNTARKKLFAQKGKAVEKIPPSQDALILHIKRAAYQAGHIWNQASVSQPILPSPSDWGWQLVNNCWKPQWTTLPEAAKCCPELKRCGCKTGCTTKRCRCVRDDVPCTALCACDGECRQ